MCGFTLTKENFMISTLVISLGIMLFSRNFCQNNVRVNLINFHTLDYAHTVLNFEDFSANQILREINFGVSRTIFVGLYNFRGLKFAISKIQELQKLAPF